MGNMSLIRTALLVAVAAAFGVVAAERAPAAERSPPAVDPLTPVIKVVGSEASSQYVSLGMGSRW